MVSKAVISTQLLPVRVMGGHIHAAGREQAVMRSSGLIQGAGLTSLVDSFRGAGLIIVRSQTGSTTCMGYIGTRDHLSEPAAAGSI